MTISAAQKKKDAAAKKKAAAEKKAGKEMIVHEDAGVPDYIKAKASARGSEEVGTEDLIIPRIEIVQSLSPARKKSDPAYIKGAEEGMLFNSVTRELYGMVVHVIPVYFRKEYLLWKDRQSGGGFRGAFLTNIEADSRKKDLEGEGEGPIAIVDTAQQFCVIVHSDGRLEEAVVSMSRSKLKISRQWNSLIRVAGGDRFSRVYDLSTQEQSNEKGDFHNYHVQALGFPGELAYKLAEKVYDDISSGTVQVAVDTSEHDTVESGPGDDDPPF